MTALGRCHESGAAPPYWPLTQVGRTLAERLGVGVVAAAAGAWAPHLQPFVDGPAAGAPDPDAAPQFLLAEAIVEALRKLAAELAAGIHARSGGNPFFVIELARLLRAEGEDALAAGTVPAGVRDVIRRRLARLPEETRHVLTVAAVAGRDFDLELVTDICGLSDDRALDHLELALVSQLVGEGTRPGAFRFSHALVREAVAETVSALRRARTHRQVADALERLYGADPDRWIAIAHHAAQAVPVTGPAAALPAVTRAARSAVTAQAPELAQRLFDQRLALAVALPPSADRDGVEMEALLDLLTIWTWTEGFHSERVEEASARVVELAGRTGQTAPVLGAFMARASWLSVSGRHLDSERNSADLDALAGTRRWCASAPTSAAASPRCTAAASSRRRPASPPTPPGSRSSIRA